MKDVIPKLPDETHERVFFDARRELILIVWESTILEQPAVDTVSVLDERPCGGDVIQQKSRDLASGQGQLMLSGRPTLPARGAVLAADKILKQLPLVPRKDVRTPTELIE